MTEVLIPETDNCKYETELLHLVNAILVSCKDIARLMRRGTFWGEKDGG